MAALCETGTRPAIANLFFLGAGSPITMAMPTLLLIFLHRQHVFFLTCTTITARPRGDAIGRPSLPSLGRHEVWLSPAVGAITGIVGAGGVAGAQPSVARRLIRLISTTTECAAAR
jgi:uncharacterized membrane protein YfcA